MRCIVAIAFLLVHSPTFAEVPLPSSKEGVANSLTEIGLKQSALKLQNYKSVKVVEEVTYATYGDRTLQLDLYSPTNVESPVPGVIVVHGGGWHSGTRQKFARIAEELAYRGFVAATISYRLADESAFPAGIQDCNAATRWVRANAKRLMVDPERIAAIGGSAGGHLVGLMGAAPHIKDFQGNGGNNAVSSALQAVISLAGPFELAFGPVAEKSINQPDESNANRWFRTDITKNKDIFVKASPYTYVSDNTPPTYFLTGEYDNVSLNYETMKKLRKHGIPTGQIVYKFGRHGCWNRNPWFDSMIDDITTILSTTFEYVVPLYQNESFHTAKWGNIVRLQKGLRLNLKTIPENRTITVPQYPTTIGKATLHANNHKAEIALSPQLDSWQFKLPGDIATPASIEIPTVYSANLSRLPKIMSASDSGFTLMAYNAEVFGQNLRYEPQPHKNTVGYWTNPKDYCQWNIYVETPGKYQVHIHQGCGKGHGGSEVAVVAADQSLKFVVEDTGHFQNFKKRHIGDFTFSEPGLYTVAIRPIKKAKVAVMDVRQMDLVFAPGSK